MAKLDIVTYGNPILRQKAEEVTEINDEIRQIIRDLEETLDLDSGVGLAAPQVGVSKRIFLVDLTKSREGRRFVLINPKIIYRSAETDENEEGCLSIPDVWGVVSRPLEVKIKGMLPDGRSVIVEGSGLLARALQHEFDHLDGKLFIDYFSPADMQKNREKIEKILEQNQQRLDRIIK